MEGDSLDSIASQLKSSVEASIATNNISNPNYILPGEVLCVPEPPSDSLSPSSGPSDFTPNYIFLVGDTIAGLANEFKDTVESIVAVNNYAAASSVRVGDALYIVNNKVPNLSIQGYL